MIDPRETAEGMEREAERSDERADADRAQADTLREGAQDVRDAQDAHDEASS